ncbi:adenylyl-sulfate kinase [Sphingorhabdus soli]|uniref:Adenylyl-sulfate kinase n=1 Tax=Flavisphingopyxis soli TaxID=2601267 RepID=A0A5C6UNP5_9SPHN|nr:adenylyl-sulfate kinase [Sphingorhabdus soli]TXC74230.1 adenylyl-sulfate kinase [Sphingorhabdus soli]
MSATRVKIVACGSIDNGKSTLIARLLLDTGKLTSDEREAALRGGDGAALASLLDGLAAEREQGITIDVAYRYFATPRRSVVLIDCPGHEQYTRNMVTGASNADLALVLVDATSGVTTQTRRHCRIAHLLGIEDYIFALNKIDLVADPAKVFAEHSRAIDALAGETGLARHNIVPVVATSGANVASRASDMPFYTGPSVLELVEDFAPAETTEAGFRLPIQTVLRGDGSVRRLAGTVASGAVAIGDVIVVLPGEQHATIAAIHVGTTAIDRAVAGQSIAITLDRQVDCARGDVITTASDPAIVADQFKADIAWLGDKPMLAGRAYTLKLATQSVSATVHQPDYRLDIETGQHLAARTLRKNDIGTAIVTTGRDIVSDPYNDNRIMGGFILIDRETGDTVAAGMIRHSLSRSQNIAWQQASVDRDAHARQKGQRAKILWFTGLSGAGKTTIANLVEQRLYAAGLHSFLLDGDNVRMGLNKDLGFTQADRVENIRRVGEVARLMTDAGLIVLATFISPFRAERELVRAMVGDGDFIEIFIDTPLAIAEDRDVKGLYAKARRGEIKNFTGLDSPYEPPEDPQIRVDTTAMTAVEAAERIARYLLRELGTIDD